MKRVSATGQHGMDRYVAQLLGRNSFFIEAGANDGFRMSNTYLLERQYGWHGVLVEAIPALASICRRRRPNSVTYCCALVAPETEGSEVEMQYADGQSTVGQRVNHDKWSIPARLGAERSYLVDVPGRTLTSILDEARAPHEPDFFSLDVEGYEAQVLAGLDFASYSPRLILVEGSVQHVLGLHPEFTRNYIVRMEFPGNVLLARSRSSGA